MSGLCIVKVGGARLSDPEYLTALTVHVRAQQARGATVVLVHGGGREIGELHELLGVPFRKVGGLRVTSPSSMALVTMVLCGAINKRLVAHLVSSGVAALGVSGADLGLIRSGFLNRDRLGRVGGVPDVSAGALKSLFAPGRVVVIAPVCLGPDGDLLNVNADSVAQAVAVAVGAELIEFVTDVDAVRTREGNADRLSPAEVQALVEDQVALGGMIPKLHAALAALDGGVPRVRLGSLGSLADGTATEVRP